MLWLLRSAGASEWTQPVFDLALVAQEVKFGTLLMARLPGLESNLAGCRQVAAKAEMNVIGLFIAWDQTNLGGFRHEQFGAIIDAAARLKLPYVAEFSTLGHESGWGISIYFANRFPHEQLPYKMFPRRSCRAEQNHRRIVKFWKSLLK